MELTPHFTVAELTRSDYAIRHGIDNTPDSNVFAGLYMLADGLERVRSVLSMPLHIISGYRSPKVNSGVGGARTSQHLQGLAADFVSDYGTPKEICQTILDHEDFIQWDQLIYEGSWVHISFSETPRGDVLTAHFGNGPVTYSRGIV